MIKIWGWEKKPRTMLRFLKSGDIFCFKYDEHTYCFGRIIGRQEDYTLPEDAAEFWFSWGDRPACRKSNPLDQTVFISKDEWKALHPLSPGGDYDVKSKLADKLKKSE